MTSPESLLDPRALRRIASLELVARQVVEGTLSGLHRSPAHGFSVEFLQHRPYVKGDDLRHLDWKVLGKTDRFFVRQYEEETNLRATLVLDASGSMAYASQEVSKLDYAVRLAAALAYLLLMKQQDAVGLLSFDRAARAFLPPRSGSRQLQLLCEELQAVRAGGESDPAKVFHDLVPRLPRRGLLIVLTDAFAEPEPLLRALTRFHNARHEVILFQILDRQEVEFEFKSWTRFDCLELEDRKILVDPAQIREEYRRRFRSFEEELEEGCHRHRIEFVPLITDRPYDEALATFLALREIQR